MKTELVPPLSHAKAARPPFTALLSTGKLEAAAACFTRDACLITPDATAIHGRESIRALLAQLVARHTQIEVELSNVLIAGETAFVQERWTVRSDGVEGRRFEQVCEPTLIFRWVEGHWKIVIAAPWGWRSSAGL
jgi:ketosteroid isomerase-like protein